MISRYFLVLNLSFLCVSAACRPTMEAEPSVSEIQGSKGKVYCGVPNDTDFLESSVDAPSVAAISEVQSGPKFADAKEILKIRSSIEQKWILRAVTPLNMGCDSFRKKGLLAYGQGSYVSFANLLLSLSVPAEKGGMAPMGSKFKSSQSKNSMSGYPLVDMLRAINSKVADNPLGKTRVAGEEVLDSNPLTNEQLVMLKQNMKEGILTSYHYDKPWKNAYGEMVTGDFLGYAKGADVEKHLMEWNDVFLDESKALDEKIYIEATARMVRRCGGIHPFHDGNGRSCTLVGVWALANRRIPHSVIWAGDDVLLSQSEWIQRFQKGVDFHRALLASGI